MKQWMKVAGLCLMMAVGAASQGAYTRSFDWEDPNVTILGMYPANGITAANVTSPVFAGNRSLQLIRNSENTPQAYLIWVTGLQQGDKVKAGFWCYDDTPGISPSGRIWAHYTDSLTNIDSYAESASGPAPYSGESFWPTDGNNWWFLNAEWTFDAGTSSPLRDGLVIEARVYGTGGIIFVDDVYVTVPDHATVHIGSLGNQGIPADFPEFPAVLRCSWRWSDTAGKDPALTTVWNRRNPNGDCRVNGKDFSYLASEWLKDSNRDVYAAEPNDYQNHRHYIYDWEDPALVSDPDLLLVWVNPFHSSGNGPFNSYNYATAELTADGGGYPNTGRAIACFDGGGSQTGELYVAWIKNLRQGDKVAASVYLKDPDTGRGSVRLWASYARFFGGYAGGTNHGDIDFSHRRFALPMDNGWARHSAEWVFDQGDPIRDQMIITIRTYTTDMSYGRRLAGWADNLVLSIPPHAEVVFPTQASLNTEVIQRDQSIVYGTGNLVNGFQDLICTVRPYGDLNHDCIVSVGDLAYLAGEWMSCGFSDPAACLQ